MTQSKRWPDHAEWAREDAIVALRFVIETAGKLLRIPQPEKAQTLLHEMQFKAQKAITDLERVKADSSQGAAAMTPELLAALQKLVDDYPDKNRSVREHEPEG